jgi:type 1 glutamine amidotransferase
MMKKQYLLFIIAAGFLTFFSACKDQKTTYKALIITGQNNHDWKTSSPLLKQILENTGMFSAEIMQTPDQGGDMTSFDPDFSKFKLVVLDYNGDSWTEKTNTGFIDFVKNGGGVVVYHAADNSFPGWKEYNEMTGLGGWGDRNEKDGPYMYYRNNELVIDTTAGVGGSHGKQREYIVKTRKSDHPVTRGLPQRWLHGTDELYSQLRGPGKNMEILATAFADSAAGGGTMRDEPILMAINYEKGRIFHTAMGHAGEKGGPAMQCAGFITTLQRGAEWAVTGDVTQDVPYDFPTVAGVVLRPDLKGLTLDEVLGRIGSYDIAKSTRYLTYLQSHIRHLAGDEAGLLDLEKKMIKVLKSSETTIDAKKLLLRELSWFGSTLSVDAAMELASNDDLKEEAVFALERLQSE